VRNQVEGQVIGGRVLPEDGLRAVPVVHVPVHDEDAPGEIHRLEPPRGDDDVVEEAEARRSRAPRVVAGRAGERERGPGMPRGDELRRRDGTARAGDGGEERAPRHGRVGIDPLDPALALRAIREAPHEQHVVGCVRLQEVLRLGGLRVDLDEHVSPEVGVPVDRVQDPVQTRRRLGMPRPRVVGEAGRVFHEDERDRHGSRSRHRFDRAASTLHAPAPAAAMKRKMKQ
jgi:hypothetical protein